MDWDWQFRTMEEAKVAEGSKDFNYSDFHVSIADFERFEEKFGMFSCDYLASHFILE